MKAMTDNDLLAEWRMWEDKIKSATSWGAGLAAAAEFRLGCEREMRRRGIDVPDGEPIVGIR